MIPKVAFLTNHAYFSEGWTDISQGFRDKEICGQTSISPKMARLQHNTLLKTLGGHGYTREGSVMGGSPFQREMITRSSSRHSNRSSVLTGEVGREKKNQSYGIMDDIHKGLIVGMFHLDMKIL